MRCHNKKCSSELELPEVIPCSRLAQGVPSEEGSVTGEAPSCVHAFLYASVLTQPHCYLQCVMQVSAGLMIHRHGLHYKTIEVGRSH